MTNNTLLTLLTRNDSQLLAALGEGTLTVADIICSATAANEAGQISRTERDHFAALATSWRNAVR
jgi:hypothetical protein